jgi:preprotein translocase subunit SecA
MAMFYRKWKDPAFLKQLRVLSAHMQKDGVDMKDMKAVQAWIEKNKDAIAGGKLEEIPGGAAKQETYVKTGPDLGPNDPCHCGSGKKFKKCCKLKQA